MKIKDKILAASLLQLMIVSGCVTKNSNSPSATAGPSPSPVGSPVVDTNKNEKQPPQVTLAVLDALFGTEAFVSELKTKLQLSDEQIQELKAAASNEVERLRTGNAEESSADSSEARSRTSEQIGRIIGADKTAQLTTMASEFWASGGETNPSADNLTTLPKAPNYVPTDTRIVVNIPAYRMDLFKDGSLIKSYKIGIGYPEFPLPQGLRKAQTIIFNPTWTPPDSPWVAKMKNITPGEKIEAGSKLNPLGPIKVPIGMPSLIHGGKSPAKLGTFASHGCVGLTTAQVKDFARMLGQIADTDLTEKAINEYLKDPTQTRAVKLKQVIPVELRYETIVVEAGTVHIFKDVYDQNTNTEENLRAVLEANGTRLEELSEEERALALNALNLMSTHPKAAPSPSVAEAKDTQTKTRKVKEKKAPKNQKEMVVELKTLPGGGYPAPVHLDVGTGKSVVTAAAR